MIIPTARLMWLAAVPLVILLNGRGSQAAVVGAWVIMGLVIFVFVGDGVMAGRPARLHLYREAPGQLYVEQPNRIAWIVENQNGFPLMLELSDRLPARRRPTRRRSR